LGLESVRHGCTGRIVLYKLLGFDDNDLIPSLERPITKQTLKQAAKVVARVAAPGLVSEFVAPRLWFGALIQRFGDGGVADF
jgi:hypothetical protein